MSQILGKFSIICLRVWHARVVAHERHNQMPPTLMHIATEIFKPFVNARLSSFSRYGLNGPPWSTRLHRVQGRRKIWGEEGTERECRNRSGINRKSFAPFSVKIWRVGGKGGRTPQPICSDGPAPALLGYICAYVKVYFT